MAFRELTSYKNILKSLVAKNLYGRYKNSLLGFGWHFLMPILMLLVYYIAFTEIRKNDLPDYWIYLSSGIFAFNFMLTNLNTGSGSIVNNSGMIKKMYFPREIIVLSQVISTLIVTVIGYVIVLAIVGVFGSGLTFEGLMTMPLVFFAHFCICLRIYADVFCINSIYP